MIIHFQYMEQKEIEKEDDVKWNLYQSYIVDDITLFETRETGTKNEILSSSRGINFLNNVKNGTIYEYIVIALLPFVLIGMCVYKKKNQRFDYENLEI